MRQKSRKKNAEQILKYESVAIIHVSDVKFTGEFNHLAVHRLRDHRISCINL